jgi:multidrug resistance protein
MFNNASANVKEGPPSPPSSAPPYTLLTKRQRQWLALLIGIATMFSPLTANIYLPCVPLLKEDFHTTLQLINMTITAYILVQGIAPTFFSQLSEKLGRRPVYILTFSIFVLSSLALSLQHSYNALLILRMVQSLGASVSTSMGYAVIADVSAPSERGKMIAPVMLTVNLGPILAPVIGGPLCGRTNWRWIFRLLTILGAAFLTVVILFLPETNRKIVGNGRIEGRGINKPLLPFLIPKASQYEQRPKAAKNPGRLAKAKAIMPNPFKSVALVFQKDTFHVLYLAGSFYMMYYVSQASLPSLLKEVYGFDETKIGLCYFTLSVGIVISSQIQGKL